MLAKRAEKGDTEKIKQLWKVGFGESDAFLDFYFKNRYRHECTLICIQEEEIVCSAQTIDSKLNFKGEILAGTYILGVVTHPDFRKQGMVNVIMEKSIKEQYEKGVAVTTLIPAQPYLFEVYRKYGFTEIFSLKECVVLAADLKEYDICANRFSVRRYTRENPFLEEEMIRFYRFYTSAYKKLDCSVLKSLDDFCFCVTEFLLFEGDIFTEKDERGKVLACAFVARGEGEWFIKEFLCENSFSKGTLLKEIFKAINQTQVLLKAPPSFEEDGIDRRLGMARVINVFEVLAGLSKSNHYFFGVKVTDPHIKENNQVFLVSGKEVLIGNNKDYVDLVLSINEFTAFALKYDLDVARYKLKEAPLASYMNLMLNE